MNIFTPEERASSTSSFFFLFFSSCCLGDSDQVRDWVFFSFFSFFLAATHFLSPTKPNLYGEMNEFVFCK